MVTKLRTIRAQLRCKFEHLKEIYVIWKTERHVDHRWARLVKGKPHNLPTQLIVSLTSYPARFDTLALTLKCLLSQTVAPDKLILWIAHQDKFALPKDVLCLQNSGLEILYCNDLRSYKKIIPTLQLFPESFIVTADDDLYYWPTWLEELTTSYSGDNHIVLCHRAHVIRLNELGEPAPYLEWELETENNETSPLNFPTGVGGVMYPPSVFHLDVLDTEVFMTCSPCADDIWLYWMVRLAGGNSRKIGTKHPLIYWQGTQESALWLANVSDDKNDLHISTMVNMFGFPIN